MDQPFNTVAQELKAQNSSTNNLKNLTIMYEAFLESPFANCQEKRLEVMELYRTLKHLFL